MNNPDPDGESFLMVIDEVFNVKGRGSVIVGLVQRGLLRKGDAIVISGKDRPPILTSVTAFIGFIRDLDGFVAEPGDTVGIVLRELETSQLEPGMVITSVPKHSPNP